MSATVRMFAHAGLTQAFVANFSEQKADQSLHLLKQPYLARLSVTVDTGTPQASTSALSPSGCRLLHIQVQPGKRVHIEVNPPGRSGGAATADTSSPVIEGDEQIEWGSGWLVSLLEASD